MIPVPAFRNQSVAVMGLARSGLAAAEALSRGGARVLAWDDQAARREAAKARGIPLADLASADLSGVQALVLSPGIPSTFPKPHQVAARAREAGIEIIGDIELLARSCRDARYAGITGTNGKSTTTALLGHILKEAGLKTEIGGNLGIPVLLLDPLGAEGTYVLEMSSYQLELTASLVFDVAVLLNITPDHLDRYDSFEAYTASKMRLFEMQSRASIAVVGTDEPNACKIFRTFFDAGRNVHPANSNVVRDPQLLWDDRDTSKWFSLQRDWPALQGPHNGENASASVWVAELLGIAPATIALALETYPGLPHRTERIREKGGVVFVNDSKATNPTATAPALAAFERIRWICGGQAKTDNLDECAPHFKHVRKAYTIGEAGELFASLLSPHMDVSQCQTLERAVGEASAEAVSGDTVLLSPACASFDQFRDFEDRGDQFRALVEGL